MQSGCARCWIVQRGTRGTIRRRNTRRRRLPIAVLMHIYRRHKLYGGGRDPGTLSDLALLPAALANIFKKEISDASHDGLTAAMLDNALPDGDGASLATRLTERGIPFLLHCGIKPIEGPCKDAPCVVKPSSHEQLRDAMEARSGTQKVKH
jgi:hypothetical protein